MWIATFHWSIVGSIATETVWTGVSGLALNVVRCLRSIDRVEIARTSAFFLWNGLNMFEVIGMTPDIIVGHL